MEMKSRAILVLNDDTDSLIEGIDKISDGVNTLLLAGYTVEDIMSITTYLVGE